MAGIPIAEHRSMPQPEYAGDAFNTQDQGRKSRLRPSQLFSARARLFSAHPIFRRVPGRGTELSGSRSRLLSID